MKRFVCCLLFLLGVFGSSDSAAPLRDKDYFASGQAPVPADADSPPLIPASQLRPVALHNAGSWSLPISSAGFPPFTNFIASYRDPETDLPVGNASFPRGSRRKYIFSSGIWIGGIVDGDTLVSNSYDVWVRGIVELWPPDPEQGGLRRTGNFADDEFMAIYTDTVGEPYVAYQNIYDDSVHVPLGVEITQRSYSWADTLYDNFVIVEFIIRNIGDNLIEDGWLAIDMDPDIFTDGGSHAGNGWADDASGVLDTLLYDGDSASRVIIPYAYDMDGDPDTDLEWDSSSITGVVSLACLGSTIAEPAFNFGWWIASTDPARDFGPRRLGTAEDPFRQFSGGGLGTPPSQRDKYYMMSHSELDYNQIEIDIHDSADGWIPSTRGFDEIVHDTKFMFSIGSFDLAPLDTVAITVAYVGSENFHVEGDDFADYFDPEMPEAFQAKLDFTELMINHRRADSVYRSGLLLPAPGPPVGLTVVDYDDDFMTIAWNSSRNPMLVGYYVNVRDTVYDDIWRRAHIDPIPDTTFTFSVTNPGHEHSFAVTALDSLGRESGFSFELVFAPGTPHPPQNFTAATDGIVPVLQWEPADDTSLAVYMIYRSSWSSPYELHDSVSALEYRDYRAESGVRYNYRLAAKNGYNLESAMTAPVSVLPMAMDQGVLFYDMNYDYVSAVDPYHRRYVDRLVHSVQPLISMDYYDIEDSIMPFKRMCDYSLIIFDSEMRGGRISPMVVDSIYNYLAGGGSGFFIVSNASTQSLGSVRPITNVYGEGSLFHDYLRLDSAVTNNIVILDGALQGDLMGCQPEATGYPQLTADMAKLALSPLPVSGYIPLAGFLFPRDSVDYLYRYQSLYPDSLFHDRVNGIRYIGDDCRIVFFNFQLSLMEAPGNIEAFRQGLTDLGIDLTCGDINDNHLLEVSDVVYLLTYLFRGGPPPTDMARADVNCDGSVDLADAQVIINAIFIRGAELSCCP